jgi:hypothetical protein
MEGTAPAFRSDAGLAALDAQRKIPMTRVLLERASTAVVEARVVARS